jgi:hypothetical protein
MPYCSNCGAQINQGDKFCNECGNRLNAQPTQQTPPPSSYQPAQAGEPVVAAISGLKQGILGRKNYVMLITGQRLVFMELTGNDIKELNRQAKEYSKARGDGLLGRMKAGFSATLNTGELFKGQDVNGVMQKYPTSVSVPSSYVNQLRIKNRGGESDDYELKIKSNGFNKKYRFSRYDKEDHQTLQMLLGDRYKSSTWFL